MSKIEFDDIEIHRCPLCGSPNVIFTDMELIKRKYLAIDVQCEDCEATWSLDGNFKLQRVLYVTDRGGDVIEEVIE